MMKHQLDGTDVAKAQSPRTTKDICFVAMPFDKSFKNIWELAIVPAIESVGLTAWRGDRTELGTNVVIQDITKSIYNCSLAIADVTGDKDNPDRANPNVMYELGLAHSAKKNVILIAQSEDCIPYDLKHIRALLYKKDDLKNLQDELKERILQTARMSENERPNYFPELVVLDAAEKKEIEYLREKSVELEIQVYPETADIFFNDQLVGTSPQTVRLNPNAQRNTVSAVDTAFFEHHEDISDESMKLGELKIRLERRNDQDLVKRVPQWLRYRRRDPHNPVLMRAVAQYLYHIEEHEEALSELQDLLDVVPNWYMAHNQIGFFHRDDPERALRYYQTAAVLNPKSYLGYYNQACAYARLTMYEKALEQLQLILDSDDRQRTFRSRGAGPASDRAFENLSSDSNYGRRFHLLAAELERIPLNP